MDTDEMRLPADVQKYANKKQLEGWWPPRELSRSEKDRAIRYVSSLVGYTLPEPPANTPVHLEIDMHRGIWIEGKVTDRETARPVLGVRLRYAPLVENRFAKGVPGLSRAKRPWWVLTLRLRARATQIDARTKPDGTYRIVGLPGRGVVRVLLYDELYLQEGYGGLDAYKGRFRIVPSAGQIFSAFSGRPSGMVPTPVREINPPQGTDTCRVDFDLVSGAKVKLRLVNLQGQPVAGAMVAFHIPHNRLFAKSQSVSEVDVGALAPLEGRWVLVHHDGRKLRRGRACKRR